jgi:arylsulfatase A-like enzyme
MNFLKWWSCILVCTGFFASRTVANDVVDRPNIVLILADDLGWTGARCFGSDFYETPNIDRLAEQGMRFDKAYANMMNCAPSRAAIMSGQYVGRHRVLYVSHYQNKWKQRNGNLKRFQLLQPPGESSLPNETLTVAESLNKAGYATGMFGKWHLGNKDQHPSRRGFDVAIESAGKHYGFETDPHVEHAQDQYLSDFLAEQAVLFIKQSHASKKPFFLYFPDFLVHKPFEAKEAYLDHFKKKPPGKNQRSPIAGAMIKSLDDSVGRIVGTLEELGITENTLIVFASDNGGLGYPEDGKRSDNTSNLPLRGQKGSEFDGGLRVPYIFSWPGKIPAGTVCNEVISGVDLYPTFLALAGAVKPSHTLDGTDLTSVLKDPHGRLAQRELFWFFPSYSSFHRPSVVVRRGDWKLIHLFESGENELYHTGRDIGETCNLAADHPERVRELSACIVRWMDQANVPRMKPNPEYQADSRTRKQQDRM